jgi:hypothetical protein
MSESKVEEDIHKDIELSETSPTPLPMQEESASIKTVSDRIELPEPNLDSDTLMKLDSLPLIPDCDSPDALRSVRTQPCKQSFPTFKVTKQTKSK